MVSRYREKLAEIKASTLAGAAPKEEVVAAALSEIGLELPEDYVQLVCELGCWYTPLGYTYFSFRQPYPHGEKGILNVFFGLFPGDEYDLLVNVRRYKGRVPRNLIPIADDPGGNLVCLSLSGANKGKVYFWDHEGEARLPGEPHTPDYSNLYLLADSLDQFINSLEFIQEQGEFNDDELPS